MNKGRFHSPKLQGPAINERIKSKSVRVISEKGEMLGVYDVQDAVKLAFEQGLDLVEVSPNASPPVCKIIDYGKYKYQVQNALLTTGCEHGILVRFVKGWQLQWFIYPRDHKMIDEIIKAGKDFWDRFDGIKNGHDYWYPPADTAEASLIYTSNGSKEVQDMSTHNKLGILIEQYVSASADEKEAKKRKDAASMYMKEIVGGHEVVTWNDYTIRHSTNQKKKTKTVTIPGEFTSYRRFTVEGGKK